MNKYKVEANRTVNFTNGKMASDRIFVVLRSESGYSFDSISFDTQIADEIVSSILTAKESKIDEKEINN